MDYNTLPDGFTSRPATMDDLIPVVAMLNRCSMAIHGVEQHTADDMKAEWTTPGFRLAEDTRLVIASNGELAGYYEVWDPTDPHVHIHLWGQTHPDYTGRGIGSYLMGWAEQRACQSIAKAPPQARVTASNYVPLTQEAAMQLHRDAGFDITRYSLRMRIDFDTTPVEPQWPAGIVVRPMQTGRDERTVALAVRESFRDHWGFVERPLEDDVAIWMHRFENDPFLRPDLHFIAWDGDQAAGVSLCYNGFYDDHDLGWISTLGVLRPWRRRGLGLALLQHSFRQLYAIGRRRMGLGVDADSLTGATRLYEKAGMRSDPKYTLACFEKELRPGVEFGTQTVN